MSAPAFSFGSTPAATGSQGFQAGTAAAPFGAPAATPFGKPAFGAPAFGPSTPAAPTPFGAAASTPFAAAPTPAPAATPARPAGDVAYTGAPSIMEQLQKIKNSWDPSSNTYAFQHYFYNKVPPEQAALYAKPADHDQTRWDAAIASRPDASSIPVLARGFTDLQKRVNSQEQQVMAYRVRMHEINSKLGTLGTHHDLETTVRLAEMKTRYAMLAHRTLKLAVKIQLVKNRGSAMRPEEEYLKSRFDGLNLRLTDPAVFGRANEIWARMGLVRERVKRSRDEGARREAPLAVDWERDDDQLEKIGRILRDQQTGLVYLAELLEKDTAEVDVLVQHLLDRRRR
ncbi:nucleoporin complex subunit 54-domain-containing protein [Dipodascopsis tothii]|uniref:nucleoporin complex subunit 54-domain-containing protein n=1 Tax=Dipodascopsis tothii TaxID=44089 RepID=UPI0034CE58FB